MIEEWRIISALRVYSVSSLGRVRREAGTVPGRSGAHHGVAQRVLAQRYNNKGYPIVTVSVNGKVQTRLVSRLVAEAFLGPAPEGKNFACHRDDNPMQNVPENLFWGSAADNSRDMVAKGRQCIGEEVTGAKLSDLDVIEIRVMSTMGMAQHRIASQFGISQSNVSMIVNRITWAHLDANPKDVEAHEGGG